MIEFYPQIKSVHVACVLASGLLFFLRGSLLLAGQRWANAAALRYLSYAIDTSLLTAALMLWTILPAAVFANGWLLLKIGLLLGYIVLGSFALKRAQGRRAQALCFVAAIAVYAWMYGVARAHHPLGPLYFLIG